jgi:alanyl-tRNA synthetase
LRAPVSEAGERLAALIEERRKLERELSDARRKLAMGGGGAGGAEAVREVGALKLYARAVSGVEMKDLKSMADEAKQGLGSGVVAIVELQRRRSRAHRLRRSRRQGRGRAPRYGPGRRARRRQGRSRAGGDRRGAARQSGLSGSGK